jgi:anti-sigma factor RsiW
VSCAQVREELGGYILGALEPAEREAVAAHLARCPHCAAEHARLAGLPALLAHAEGLEIPAPPPAVEERVLDRIAQERGAARRGRRRLLARFPGWARGRTLLAGGLAGAVIGAGATALVLQDDPANEAAAYSVALRGDGGASARAQLEPGSGGTKVQLWVEGLPPGGETVYEVLCERPGWSASAGTFRADSRGRAYAVLTTAARIGEYESIRVVRSSDETAVLSGRLH